MSNDQHSHRRRRGPLRWWRSWLGRLPQQLTSRRFNLYQVVLAVIASYFAFRIISFLFLGNLDTPPDNQGISP
jgi:hypothetical protein